MKHKKKININSSSQNYYVEFNNANKLNFKNHISEGDIIIIDKKIFDLHNLSKKLPKNKIIKILANEKNKSFQNLNNIIRNILNIGFKKNKKIIVIGGGITQDIGSFISSILYRGVDWIFYPTSFLSQCDSCIGGKTSINFFEYKNQIGNFHPPRKIIIDINFLKTQTDKEIRSGVGEMAHYFFVSSNNDYNFFLKSFKRALLKEKKISELMIYRCLSIKKFFIEKDEFDRKERLLLNYGHTFGHAIEALTHYKIPHGIAVAHGINIANYLSLKKNFITKNYFYETKKAMDFIIEGYMPQNLKINRFIKMLKRDKKNINQNLRCILTKGPGRMFIYELAFDKIFKENLSNYFNKYLINN